jgi:endonuclease/exonuclease/phosphatase family metal-dependent hydrolase
LPFDGVRGIASLYRISMRVVTYNTRGSLGMDGFRSTRRIIEVLRALTPDMVAFQEIHQRLPWSRGEDQPLALEVGLGRPFVFHRLLRYGRGGYGIGMAARGTVAERLHHLLPSGREQRGALELRLREIDGMRLTSICTHWGLDAEERISQARALIEIVRAAPRPVIVCGDLNEDREGQAVQLLLNETDLQDADAERQRPTFVADNPKVRIDFVLYTPELAARRVEVIDTLASDHLPVLVDFERRA